MTTLPRAVARHGPAHPEPGLPRSGQRPPRQIGGIRMALYLAAAVVGVVVIVYLVVHLTKSGSNSAASGTSTPSKSTTTTAAAAPVTDYVVTQAANVGPYPLNKAATTEYTAGALNQSAAIVAKIKAQGAGQPGKNVVGMYDLGSITHIASSSYKGVAFVGYDGTFNMAAVIKYEKTQLKSSRMVAPGPHGGKMMCGYNTSSGAEASECVWVTPTHVRPGRVHRGPGSGEVPGRLRPRPRDQERGRGPGPT